MDKQNQKRKRTLTCAAALAVLLFLMIGTRFDATRRNIFENFSENFVSSGIYAAQNGLEINGGGYGLISLTVEGHSAEWSAYYQQTGTYLSGGVGQEGDVQYSYGVYRSQLGLQGHVFSWLAGHIPTPKVYWLFRGGCIAALELVLLLISIQLYKKYGPLLAGCFLLVSEASPWITNFSANLYWVEFTWFIPMWLGLLCLNHPRWRFWIYPCVYLAIVLKTMCGYEYITTVMMGSIVFLCADFLAEKSARKQDFFMVLGIGIACLLGFATTFSLHAWLSGGKDILKGFAGLMHDLVQRRTWGNASGWDDYIASLMETSVWVVLGKYLWHNFAGKLTSCMLLLASACLLVERRVWKQKNDVSIYLLGMNVLSSISWFVLAKGHSSEHTPLNFVMWHMGCMQIAVYIVVDFLWTYHKRSIAQRSESVPCQTSCG